MLWAEDQGSVVVFNERRPSRALGWTRRSVGVAGLVALLLPGASGAESYVIGTWNLEHFTKQERIRRGSPEDPDRLPPRVETDFRPIARIIRDLKLKILVLQEVDARESNLGVVQCREEAEPPSPPAWYEQLDGHSHELDELRGLLGPHWKYLVGSHGERQRIAVLFDTQATRLNCACEGKFEDEIQGARVFEHEPIFAHFSFLRGGEALNDLGIVGLQLVPGETRGNHRDVAVRKVEAQLTDFIQGSHDFDRDCLPEGEFDRVIMGLFNTDKFEVEAAVARGEIEDSGDLFWESLNPEAWRILVNASYPSTRITTPSPERIDYIIVSTGRRTWMAKAPGLYGEEIRGVESADVHEALAKPDPWEYRRLASDHLPVTIQIELREDND